MHQLHVINLVHVKASMVFELTLFQQYDTPTLWFIRFKFKLEVITLIHT
jgi:hypothetical protein